MPIKDNLENVVAIDCTNHITYVGKMFDAKSNIKNERDVVLRDYILIRTIGSIVDNAKKYDEIIRGMYFKSGRETSSEIILNKSQIVAKHSLELI